MIRTDSQYSIQCKSEYGSHYHHCSEYTITGLQDWLTRWKNNDWKTSGGDDVKNAGIIRCISKQLDIRAKSGQRVALEYVKGHSGDAGNDGADAMANKGALLPATAERNWNALEKRLDEELSNTISGGKVPKITVLAPGGLPGKDDEGAPTKVRKVSDEKESFSTSKLVAQHSSLNKSAITSPKGEHGSLSTASSNNLSKPSASENVHLLPLSSIQQGKYDMHKNPQKPISIYPHISGEKSPLSVICAHPPLVPVPVEDINLHVGGQLQSTMTVCLNFAGL